jgi:hypothetical protein
MDPPVNDDHKRDILKKELMKRLDIHDDRVMEDYATLYNSAMSLKHTNLLKSTSDEQSDHDQHIVSIAVEN